MLRLLAVLLLALPCALNAVELPDSSMTPGATFNVDAATVCQPGYSGTVRDVPESEKMAVYRSYGVAGPGQGYCDGSEGCEIDHLISLEIGGSNEQTNLWPQPYQGTWNAHMKDHLEDYFHAKMCTKVIAMSDAQQQISTNWITAYQKYITSSHAQTALYSKLMDMAGRFEQGEDVYSQFWNGTSTFIYDEAEAI